MLIVRLAEATLGSGQAAYLAANGINENNVVPHRHSTSVLDQPASDSTCRNFVEILGVSSDPHFFFKNFTNYSKNKLKFTGS